MSTPATTAGNNNLHGTLRFLSKKYSPKSSKSKLVKRARRGVPTIRKSSTPRSDRLQVVSIVSDSKNDTGNEGNQTNSSSEAVGGKGPLSPETEVKVEPSAATALATNASTGAPGKSDAQAKPGETAAVATKTITTTKLFHPEDLAQYKEAEATQEEALKKIEMARQQVYSDQVQKVWGVYTYGLKHVLALNDLSNAPDAILPGNFSLE